MSVKHHSNTLRDAACPLNTITNKYYHLKLQPTAKVNTT